MNRYRNGLRNGIWLLLSGSSFALLLWAFGPWQAALVWLGVTVLAWVTVGAWLSVAELPSVTGMDKHWPRRSWVPTAPLFGRGNAAVCGDTVKQDSDIR
jgi:threonine/homoserine/homoserine lactone efflux protein